MTQEGRSDQTGVPGPRIVLPLGIGGGMDADEATAGLDVALEGKLLFAIEHVAGCVEKDHRSIFGERIFRESSGIFGGIDCDATAFPLGFENFETAFDIFVPIFRRPCEYQDARSIGREFGNRAAAGRPQEAQDQKPHDCSHVPSLANSGLEIKQSPGAGLQIPFWRDE